MSDVSQVSRHERSVGLTDAHSAYLIRAHVETDSKFDALQAVADTITTPQLLLGLNDFLGVRHSASSQKLKNTPDVIAQAERETGQVLSSDNLDQSPVELLARLDELFDSQVLSPRKIRAQHEFGARLKDTDGFLSVAHTVRQRMAAGLFVDAMLEGATEAPNADIFSRYLDQLTSEQNLERLQQWGGTFNLVSQKKFNPRSAFDRQLTLASLAYVDRNPSDVPQVATALSEGLMRYRAAPKTKKAELNGARDELLGSIGGLSSFVVIAVAGAVRRAQNGRKSAIKIDQDEIVTPKQQFAALVLEEINGHDEQVREDIILEYLGEFGSLTDENPRILEALEVELLENPLAWDRTQSEVGRMAYQAPNMLAKVAEGVSRYVVDPQMKRFATAIGASTSHSNLDSIVRIGNGLSDRIHVKDNDDSADEGEQKDLPLPVLSGVQDLPRALDRLLYVLRQSVPPLVVKKGSSRLVKEAAKRSSADFQRLATAARIATLLAHNGVDSLLRTTPYKKVDWMIRYPDADNEQLEQFMAIDDGSSTARRAIHRSYLTTNSKASFTISK